jgi:signal transduction histidine kinase
MEPLLFIIVVVALLGGFVAGIAVGRGSGRGAALEQGRAEGLKEGQAQGRLRGAEEGRSEGFEKGRAMGVEEAREASEARLQALIDAVKRGRKLEEVAPGSVEARLQSALEVGWAPRETEREAALREAIGRVSSFLHAQVREPLAGVSEESDEAELRERIERALGSLEDLEFFIRETEEVRQGADLTKLAQTVAREFAGDHDVGVRVMLGQAAIRAHVNTTALMDALYLVLHNADRFGGGGTIDLTVDEEGGRARITVRDRGEGFSEEAFKRAFDPFYSTSDEGLGLGLPHARKVIEEMGGAIELRNMPDGGAEVEVTLPTSS